MFALNYRERLAGLSEWIVSELDQIVATAQARWWPEHDERGRHTNLTATSVTTPRLALTDSAGNAYSLYVSSGTLYIVAGTGTTGGTVVGTQT